MFFKKNLCFVFLAVQVSLSAFSMETDGSSFLVPAKNLYATDTVDNFSSKQEIIGRLMYFITPKNVTNKQGIDNIKKSLENESIEVLERKIEFSKVLLAKDLKESALPPPNFGRYNNLLTDVVDAITPNNQCDFFKYIEGISFDPTKVELSQHWRSILEGYESYFLKNTFFLETLIENGSQFPLTDGYSVKFLKKFSGKNNLPEMSQLEFCFKKPFDTFLLINESGEVVGYRPITIMDRQIDGESIVLQPSQRGKGIGKAFFLKILEIISRDPILGHKEKFCLDAVSDSGKGLIESIKKDNLSMTINPTTLSNGQIIWKVSIEMGAIRNYFLGR